MSDKATLELSHAYRRLLADYRAQRELAERVSRTRLEKCREHLAAAGLGADCPMGVLHNALVGELRGKPWAGIDYHELRKAEAIRQSMFEPYEELRVWWDEQRRTVSRVAEVAS